MKHHLMIPAGSIDSDRKNSSHSTPMQVLIPGYKRDYRFQEDLLVVPEGFSLAPTTRLLVLVPENDFDENQLSQRIWNLAAKGGLSVSFVLLSSKPGTEHFLRTRLATLVANTRDGYVAVNSKIVLGNNWIQAVNGLMRPGDLLVCLEDFKATSWGVFRRPAGQTISSSLGVPVYILSGIRLGSPPRYSNRGKEVIFWLAAIGIIVGFAFVQIMINNAIQGWLSSPVLMITVIFEILLITILNDVSR